GDEIRIRAQLRISLGQFRQGRHQGLGYVQAAVVAEAAMGIGIGVVVVDMPGHVCIVRVALMKARILSWLLMPGADSMPLDTSTAHGCTRSMACSTLRGSSPPARISGFSRCAGIRDQSNA